MRLIDADALLERWCSEVCKPKPNCSEDCFIYDYLTMNILSPTIEPVKRGRWIEDNDPNADHFFRKGWKCSVCGSRTSYGTPPYCMRCGAKMEPISASPENGKEVEE